MGYGLISIAGTQWIEDCIIEANRRYGIYFEISQGPCTFRNNVIIGNQAGINIAESGYATVTNNVLLYNPNSNISPHFRARR